MDWSLNKDNISGIVRDNGANMVLGISLVGWPDIPCFRHTLQLLVGAGLSLSDISSLTACCRKLVGHYKHSRLSTSALKDKQKNLNYRNHTLIQDVSTRWNLSYFMLERLVEQRWAIYGVLHNDTVSKPDHKKLDLKEEQWELSLKLLAVLKPLQVATTALCSKNHASLSSVYPVVYGLLKKHLVSLSDDPPTIKLFKETITSQLKQRFNPDSENVTEHIPVLASAIDSRYHYLKFLSNEQRTLTYSKLEKLAEATQVDEDETPESDNELEEPTTKKPKTESAIEYLLGNSLGRSSDTKSPHDEMHVFIKS